MSKTLTGLYENYEDATSVVRDLEAIGIPYSDISLVANNTSDRVSRGPLKEGNEAGPGAAGGATLGGIVGGATGLMAGLGMLAIPGVGPVVAAGWLVATAAGAAGGAVLGAAGGGLIGAMVGNGVPEEDANVYAEGVRRGGTLVTVRADDRLAARAESILQEYRRVDPVARGQLYRESGWTRFDDKAPAFPLTEREREEGLPLIRD
jgi:hypothetical protein